jgi:transcriptional regulator with XRE-family HTH domain
MMDHPVPRLDDPEDQWVDADELRIQLAAERIAAARKAAGLTQKQLGEKLNLPQSQISRIERKPDHTTVRTLKRIAKALGVDVRALIG